MKENDYILANILNPEFDNQDFKEVLGMDMDNTQILPYNSYVNNDYIRSIGAFQDSDGTFNEDKFKKYYQSALVGFQDFSTNPLVDDSFEYGVFDAYRKPDSKVKDPQFQLMRVMNPNHESIGIGGINQTAESPLTGAEIAQTQKIFDSATGKYLDYSPNDISLTSNVFGWFKSLFDDPLVRATYDEDGFHKDPFTGEMVGHKKGEYKLNDNGEYFYETLNGRSLIGKEVLSATDILTVDGEGLNKYDFLDSDDKEKSIMGSLAKTALLVTPLLFGGPVSATYSALLVAKEMTKSLPMLQGMLSSAFGDGSDSKLINTLAGYANKFTMGVSEHSKQNVFTWENTINLMGDVALQWGQQQYIAKAIADLQGSTKKVKAAEKAAKEFYKLNTGKEAIGEEWLETTVGRIANKTILMPAKIEAQNAYKLGADASLVYMALVSNEPVYEEMLNHGASKRDAALVSFASSVGMFGVDKWAHLGEIFFDELKNESKIAFRNTVKDQIEKSMDSLTEIIKNPEVKKKTKNLIMRGMDIGKKAVNKFNDDLKNHTLGFFGKAIGEGLEEVSEEFVTDISKTIYEVAGEYDSNFFNRSGIRDVGAWDNMLERYSMSLIGGTLGGGLFYGVGVVKGGNFKRDNTKDNLINLVANNKTNELLEQLDKLRDQGKLGSTTLSATKYENTSDNKPVYLTTTDSEDTQNQYVYNRIKESILQIDQLLKQTGTKLSDQDLFNQLVQNEERFTQLSELEKEQSYLTRYQEDFRVLTRKLIDAEKDYQNALTSEDGTPGGKQFEGDVIGERYKTDAARLENIAKAKKTVDELRKARNDFASGKASLPYLEKLLFTITPNIHNAFMSMTYAAWVKNNKGKDVLTLTDSEHATYKQEYLQYKKDNQKDDIEMAYSFFKQLQELVNPELKNISEKAKAFKENDEMFQELFGNESVFVKYKLIDYNGKLEEESEEEYNNRDTKLEGETDQEFEARKNARINKIEQNNLRNINKINDFIQELIDKTGGIDLSTSRQLVNILGTRKRDQVQRVIDDYSDEQAAYNVPVISEIIRQLNVDNYGNITNINDIIEKIASHVSSNKAKAIVLSTDDTLEDAIEGITSLMSYSKEVSEDEKEQLLNKWLQDDDMVEEIVQEYNAIVNQSKQEAADLVQRILKKIQRNPFIQFFDIVRSKLIANNPIQALISKLPVNNQETIEQLLNNMYERMLGLRSKEDFILTGEEESSIEEAVNVLNALSSLLATQVENPSISDSYAAIINEFGKKYKADGFEELVILDDDVTATLKMEIDSYLEELTGSTSLLNVSSINQVNTIQKLINTDTNYAKSMVEFFHVIKSSGNFKFVHNGTEYDLLEGIDQISDEEPQVKLAKIEHLYYTNLQKCLQNMSFTEVLDACKLISKDDPSSVLKLDEVLGQRSIELNEKFEFNSVTDYQKFIYLLSISALDSEEFNTYVRSTSNDTNTNGDPIVPLTSQEVVIRTGIAKLKDNSIFEQGIAYIKDHINKYQFTHITFIDGLAGTGKSSVCAKKIIQFKNTDQVWVSSNTDVQTDSIHSAIGKGTKFNKKQLFEKIIDPHIYEQLMSDLDADKTNSELFTFKTDPDGNNYILVNFDKITFNNVDDAPVILLIDEITHFSNAELQILNKFAQDHNVQIIGLGDTYQSGFEHIGENVQRPKGFMVRSPKLSISLRANNSQKFANLNKIKSLIDFVYTVDDSNDPKLDLFKRKVRELTLQVYNKEEINGDLITDTITEETARKLSGSIAYVGDTNTEAFNTLKSVHPEVKVLSVKEVQGQEFDNVVINIDWNYDFNQNASYLEFLRKLYTMISRGRTNSIIIDNNLTHIIQGNDISNRQMAAPNLQSSANVFIEQKNIIYNKLNVPVPSQNTPQQGDTTQNPQQGGQQNPQSPAPQGQTPQQGGTGQGGQNPAAPQQGGQTPPAQNPPSTPQGGSANRVVKYGNSIFNPSTGVITFNTRGLKDAKDSSKYFIVELDDATGTGTYRINPDAIDYIKGDIDVFRDTNAVEMDTAGVTANNIKDLKDTQVGTLIKDGDGWKVNKKLKVEIIKEGVPPTTQPPIQNPPASPTVNPPTTDPESTESQDNSGQDQGLTDGTGETPAHKRDVDEEPEEDEQALIAQMGNDNMEDKLKSANLDDNSESIIQEGQNRQESVKQTNSFPIRVYSEVSLSGLVKQGTISSGDRKRTIYRKGNNLNNPGVTHQDLQIFIDTDTIDGNNLTPYVKQLRLLKSAIVYEREWEDLPSNFRDFLSSKGITKQSFNELKKNIHIKIRKRRDSDHHIGWNGLESDKLTIGEYVYTVVAQVTPEGSTNTFEITLGALANPDSYTVSEWARSNGKEEQTKQNIQSYKTLFDSLTQQAKQAIDQGGILDLVPGTVQFSGTSYLRHYQGTGAERTRVPVTDIGHYRATHPFQVITEKHIIVNQDGSFDQPKGKIPLGGKTVLFVSDDLTLEGKDLYELYIKQREANKDGRVNPSSKKYPIRMIILTNTGIAYTDFFKYGYNYSTQQMIRFPFERDFTGARMMTALWNYRASLYNFKEYLDDFIKKGIEGHPEIILTKELILEALKEEAKHYDVNTGTSTVDENNQYYTIIKAIKEFNDSLSDSVRQFRLGYYAEEKAFNSQIRVLTNANKNGNPFYGKIVENSKTPNKQILGTYISPQSLDMQIKLLDTLMSTIESIEINGVPFKLVDKDGNIYDKTRYITYNEGYPNSVSQLTNLVNQETITVDGVTITGFSKSFLKLLPLFLKEIELTARLDRGDNTMDVNGVKVNTTNLLDTLNEYANGEQGYGSDNFSLYTELLNLIFHGNARGDISRSTTHATDAMFKYGFFIDPYGSAVIENTNKQAQLKECTMSDKMFLIDVEVDMPVFSISLGEMKKAIRQATQNTNPSQTEQTPVGEQTPPEESASVEEQNPPAEQTPPEQTSPTTTPTPKRGRRRGAKNTAVSFETFISNLDVDTKVAELGNITISEYLKALNNGEEITDFKLTKDGNKLIVDTPVGKFEFFLDMDNNLQVTNPIKSPKKLDPSDIISTTPINNPAYNITKTPPFKARFQPQGGRGKLIYAQSGTGKTTIADNETVFDSDWIKAKLLGVPTELAGTVEHLMSDYVWVTEEVNGETVKRKVPIEQMQLLNNPEVAQQHAVIMQKYENGIDLTNSEQFAEFQQLYPWEQYALLKKSDDIFYVDESTLSVRLDGSKTKVYVHEYLDEFPTKGDIAERAINNIEANKGNVSLITSNGIKIDFKNIKCTKYPNAQFFTIESIISDPIASQEYNKVVAALNYPDVNLRNINDVLEGTKICNILIDNESGVSSEAIIPGMKPMLESYKGFSKVYPNGEVVSNSSESKVQQWINGIPAVSASDEFNVLVTVQINQLLDQGMTVLSTRNQDIGQADYIVYNETDRQSKDRTGNFDRGNQYDSTDAWQKSMDIINKVPDDSKKYALKEGEYLGHVLLESGYENFNITLNRIKENKNVAQAIQTFFGNFGITVEEYGAAGYSIDYLQRVIQGIHGEGDLVEGAGEFISFMMQWNERVKHIIGRAEELKNPDGTKYFQERKTKAGQPYTKFNDFAYKDLNKANYFKMLGALIDAELARQFNVIKNTDNVSSASLEGLASIEDIKSIISSFDSKVSDDEDLVEEIYKFVQYAAFNMLANNQGIILQSITKPGAKMEGRVYKVNVEQAFDENPWEFEIVKALSNTGVVSLAGSTAMATQGVVYRPLENPLHDLDFNTYATGKVNSNEDAKAEVDKILNQVRQSDIQNRKHVRTMNNPNKETGNIDNYTVTYLVLADADGRTIPSDSITLEQEDYVQRGETKNDNTHQRVIVNGEVIGHIVRGNITFTKAGFKGKLLDFFVHPNGVKLSNGTQLHPREYNYKGTILLMTDYRMALAAKQRWARLKDIFDYNRFVKNEQELTTRIVESTNNNNSKAIIDMLNEVVGKVTIRTKTQKDKVVQFIQLFSEDQSIDNIRNNWNSKKEVRDAVKRIDVQTFNTIDNIINNTVKDC